jgi:hypothetical protein
MYEAKDYAMINLANPTDEFVYTVDSVKEAEANVEQIYLAICDNVKKGASLGVSRSKWHWFNPGIEIDGTNEKLIGTIELTNHEKQDLLKVLSYKLYERPILG